MAKKKQSAKRKVSVKVKVGASRKASHAEIHAALQEKLKTEPTEFQEGDEIVIDFNWIDESKKSGR